MSTDFKNRLGPAPIVLGQPPRQEPDPNSAPVFIELNLGMLLLDVRDRDKVRCIKILLDRIMEEGVIDDIRNLVNHPRYND